ncbi:hypothetical protein KIN20_005697 [Parelaphostrongylus tenuis]|uniref:Poly(A) RNA polymerase mitochondrial-like central palm domain-containing protein n=1 Tax=Parelaphostrongylus tenuis TaxID=148309 RepID=A0AAD5M2J4_PARTN|nr:hypothetical protein KIN20_005697 [Parelaphostrongylus tenuis]
MSKEDDLVIVEECKRYAEKYMVEQNIAAIKQFRKYYSSHFADPRYAEEFRMLSDEIFRRFQRNRQTSAEFRRKMVMIDEIGKVIQKNQSWRFKLFPSGSTMTGLATKGSDLDVTIWCPDANRLFSNESEAAFNILRQIRHFLFRDPISGEINFMRYVEAKVPLLKIDFKGGVNVDLSCCTESYVPGIQNSFLIRGYAL